MTIIAPSRRQQILQHAIKIRERTDPSHRVIRDRFWTWRARQRRVSISCGTVFQTALHELLVIPRLRPGLLSLRSVLASSQILVLSIINHAFMNYQLWIVNYELWIVNCELWIILLLRLTAQCACAQNSSRIKTKKGEEGKRENTNREIREIGGGLQKKAATLRAAAFFFDFYWCR